MQILMLGPCAITKLYTLATPTGTLFKICLIWLASNLKIMLLEGNTTLQCLDIVFFL